MAQYCRYCSHCYCSDSIYCDEKKKTMSEIQAKRTNKCKHFEFNEMDVFDFSKIYHPRKQSHKNAEKTFEQLKLL